MIRVVKIDINDKIYGGRVYENEMVKQLDGYVEFDRVFIMKHKLWVLNIMRFIGVWFHYKFFFKGVLLLTNATTLFAGLFSTNIVIIHHIDSHISLRPMRLYDYLCDKYLFLRAKTFDKIVVVASIWKELLAAKGLSNISIIYNSFDPDDFVFSPDDIQGFKAKYKLNEKPIVFLGNGIKGKGADVCYDILKDMDAHFVTTGKMDFDIPVIHLTLNYSEYKLLLASSSVVLTMSEFNEGWNRVAHEASLCGTPVVGSGRGGMRELLEIAGQTVSDFDHLKNNVLARLDKYDGPTERLKALNMDYFKKSWEQVFKEFELSTN